MELPCVLCGSSEQDMTIFGIMNKEDNMVAHYNCLILSLRNFVYHGNDVIDLLSYLRNDISDEASRCRSTRCFYCGRLGANINCCHNGCLRSFHIKCGVENLAIHQYGGSLDTFCHQHVPEYRARPDPGEECIICLQPVVPDGGTFSVAMALQAPCCTNGWYHRRCLQLHANYSGILFRCPLCMNRDKFRQVWFYGISIPNKRYLLPLLPDELPPNELPPDELASPDDNNN